MRRKKLPRTLVTPLDEGASSRDANIVENLVSLFAPDVLLGCDYEIAYCGRERARGRLMATVLEQTVADFQRDFLSQAAPSLASSRLFAPRLGALEAKQRR